MAKRRPRCRWCRKMLDSKEHQDVTEGLCFIRNERKLRSKYRPRVKTVADVYDDAGKMRAEFVGTDMEDRLMQRQRSMAVDALLGLSKNGYKVPKNVEFFLQGGFVWNQVAQRYPWAVYVLIPVEGGRPKRKRKRFNNLYEAVEYHSKVMKKYPSSGIVSLAQSYELPAEWRIRKDKLPKRFKWCPHCGTFRVFKIVHPREEFTVLKKVWSDEKQRFMFTERRVALVECQLCGHTNRSPIWRRSNQPWEVRRFKPGVKRARRRHRTSPVVGKGRVILPEKKRKRKR